MNTLFHGRVPWNAPKRMSVRPSLTKFVRLYRENGNEGNERAMERSLEKELPWSIPMSAETMPRLILSSVHQDQRPARRERPTGKAAWSVQCPQNYRLAHRQTPLHVHSTEQSEDISSRLHHLISQAQVHQACLNQAVIDRAQWEDRTVSSL